MAQIILTIPDGVIQRVLDAYADLYRWDGANPATKTAFARQQIAAEIRATVRRHETGQAAAAIQAAVDSEVTIS